MYKLKFLGKQKTHSTQNTTKTRETKRFYGQPTRVNLFVYKYE